MATGYLGNYAENELLDHALKTGAYTPATHLYIALSTADPTDDASGIAEPSGGSYARVAHDAWNAASARAATNDGQIDFPEATGNWGTITHFAIYDADTAGNMLVYGPLSSSKVVNSGDNPYFADEAIALSWDSGAIGTYLANKLLDHLLKTAAYTPETHLYVTVSTADPTDDASGLAEPDSGDAFARVQCDTWDAASGGASANTGVITFPTATGSWGTLSHFAVFNGDTLGAGDLLFYGALTASKAAGTGDTPRFAAGALDIALN